ncbi:MAG TPA: hypothetical protein VE990_18610 [Acidimicrobiales bacterium]|nr:hypothetical protein [Acidimicrobiales bacterium]
MPIEPADLERLLGSQYLDGLSDSTTDEVRAKREELQRAEVAVSYVRRLLQGRIDIVEAERRHRSSGAGESLVDELPSILAEGGRTAGPGRLPQHIDPGQEATELAAEVDRVVDPARLADVASLSEADLESMAGDLRRLEREVSERRRALHERLDAIHAELVRRYRSGEATVDTLLR